VKKSVSTLLEFGKKKKGVKTIRLLKVCVFLRTRKERGRDKEQGEKVLI